MEMMVMMTIDYKLWMLASVVHKRPPTQTITILIESRGLWFFRKSVNDEARLVFDGDTQTKLKPIVNDNVEWYNIFFRHIITIAFARIIMGDIRRVRWRPKDEIFDEHLKAKSKSMYFEQRQVYNKVRYNHWLQPLNCWTKILSPSWAECETVGKYATAQWIT